LFDCFSQKTDRPDAKKTRLVDILNWDDRMARATSGSYDIVQYSGRRLWGHQDYSFRYFNHALISIICSIPWCSIMISSRLCSSPPIAGNGAANPIHRPQQALCGLGPIERVVYFGCFSSVVFLFYVVFLRFLLGFFDFVAGFQFL
jgi:hypothetical protein